MAPAMTGARVKMVTKRTACNRARDPSGERDPRMLVYLLAEMNASMNPGEWCQTSGGLSDEIIRTLER